MKQPLKFCEHPYFYSRRPTHEVKIGDVGVGGNNPIRVQSMTIADTMDTSAAVTEVIQLYDAGCEIIRLTAPSINEAKNLRHIKAELQRQNINVPLVADIHYTPNAALIAADFVEKVRINPGNYTDKKKFEIREYTDSEYQAILDGIALRFTPLVKKCKENGTVMRIGVNHGSLSDRIMCYYGDTPEGMVQSALEFIHICEACNYRDIVVSMKSSNTQVMIQAYRLLAARMYDLNMTYPFHLGVTEAGDGEDGRIKSAVGIGALLEDGLGDTIRVSLTEDAIYEVPVASALVEKFNKGFTKNQLPEAFNKNLPILPEDFTRLVNPYEYKRRIAQRMPLSSYPVGGNELVRVGVSLANSNISDAEICTITEQKQNGQLQILGAPKPEKENFAEWLETDFDSWDVSRLHQCLNDHNSDVPIAAKLNGVHSNDAEVPQTILLEMDNASDDHMAKTIHYSKSHKGHLQVIFKTNQIENKRVFERYEALKKALNDASFENWSIAAELPVGGIGGVGLVRAFVAYLKKVDEHVPLIWRYRVPKKKQGEQDKNFDWKLDCSAQLGSLFCDGLGDALIVHGAVESAEALTFSYNLLQAVRLRISKTEFISCPSCGRTLFNLQTTTERIKKKTGHLKGVKVAVMGCIVNGPGEMADADFGYVGTGPKEISLYVGKECVQRNIPEDEADRRLIDLIKLHGKWVEPA